MFANKVSAGKRYDSTMNDCRITSNKHVKTENIGYRGIRKKENNIE